MNINYAKNNLPFEIPVWHFGGFKWSNIQISGKDGKTAGPIGTKLCAHNYADDPGNGHRLTKIGPVR